jgi:ATP-dependent DNA ligase
MESGPLLSQPTGLPDWIKPQLTKLVDIAPDGPDWLREIKYDGYRMHARLDRGAVKLLTRTGLNWTHKYPPMAVAVARLKATQAYLEGDLRGVRPDGTTSFSLMSDAGPACITAIIRLAADGPSTNRLAPRKWKGSFRSAPMRRTLPVIGACGSKLKCLNREEFVVIGWTDPEGSCPRVGALLLGY